MPRLFLIDVFGFLFRAYHARARSAAPPMRTGQGRSTEAVFIFHNMIRKLLTSFSPEYLAAVFESKGPTFREQSFADYKANRTEMPPDLSEQIPYVYRVLEALRIPSLQLAGFEADDVIGAVAKSAPERGADVVIVSSDKDMMQLVNDRVSMLNPMKDDTWYDAAKVADFMGVPPAQITDLLALMGDSIDNIPGAPGIGEKGARDLILRFGSVEAAIERAAEVERKTYRESLSRNRDQILLSKRLATIDVTAPIEWDLAALCCKEPDTVALKEIYRELEFFSLLKELGPSEAPADADYQSLDSAEAVDEYLASVPPGASIAVTLARAAEGELSFDTVLGLSHKTGVGRAASFQFLDRLRPLLEDAGRPKVTHDIKSLIVELEKEKLTPAGFTDDVMLEAFLINSDPSSCSLENLSERHLDQRLSGAADQRAACAFELHEKLRPEITVKDLEKLYFDVDLPLAPVLARMQTRGIRIEPSQMQRLGERLDTEIQRLTAEIHHLAGKPFNINSPQQLGKVLFEDLGLPAPVRYGKGKTISTAADVLEALAETHEIVAKVLDYRQLVKLKGTYVDALPNWVDPATGRLHTSLNQAGAATGRLSSSNPNLQNIPIRTELGREIRAAFVPQPGWKLLVADYSQIELRLLAHLSGDPLLVDSFRKGEDVHTRTATEVFGAIPGMVTAEMRRRAKAVNFGIVYGQTAFGLAQGLGIGRAEADTYIRNYFKRYAGVKTYIEATIEEVKRTGVSRNMFGRLRPIPDIRSRNPNARGFAERTAVNTPMQGGAADLIKIAMIRIDEALRQADWRTRMLLQVHDELLFEAPPEEVERASALVKDKMEGVYELTVPLVVEVGIGENWRDAK